MGLKRIFKTPFIYIVSCWENANRVVALRGSGNRLSAAFDLFWSFLRFGARSEDYFALEFYKLNSYEKRKFLTTQKNWFSFYKKICIPEVAEIFNSKEKFNRAFDKYLGREWMVADGNNIDETEKFVIKHGRVIAKPEDGAEGFGIFIVDSGKLGTLERLHTSCKNGAKYMLERLIKQHSEMAHLNEASVNTIRVETMIDSHGVSHITNTTVIMGTGGDVVNNAHNGGIMCHVDEESGLIASHARNPHGDKLFRHPDTGLVLPGYQIPMWKEVKKFALDLSKVEKGVRYIGWDIAITENGPVVIEGNTRPGHCTQACDMVGRWPLLKSMI